MKIYKYPFPVIQNVTIKMPKGARILTVQMQGENPYIWAIVDQNMTKEDRHFKVYGTGHDLNMKQNEEYIGTWQEGSFVWHLFEVKGD